MPTSLFTDLLDLAGKRAGGCVLAGSDHFSAKEENLTKPADAVFVADNATVRVAEGASPSATAGDATDSGAAFEGYLIAVERVEAKSKNLRSTRLLLLPRLTSGEIDVSQVTEQLLEASA